MSLVSGFHPRDLGRRFGWSGWDPRAFIVLE